MEKKLSTFLFTLFTILWSFLASTQATNTHTRQTDALDNLYRAKFYNKDKYHSTIDTSLFEVNGGDDVSDYRFKITEQNNLRVGDKIERLPGQPHVRFDQYGGYVTIDEKAGRAFYYYFVEAEKAMHSKPLLLWLNGGPGCSSLAYGAMEELGPFRVRSDGKTLYKNRYAWNHANVLFLESPAGVGFSYSNTSTDMQSSGDRKTAEDNTIFLLNWLERFPEYKNRDFYIAGESYAGHYVPQLAHNILLQNKKANKTLVNLKGVIIGNAVINDETDTIGMYDYFNTHALVSDEITSRIKRTCNFSGAPISKECSEATIDAEVATNNIDIYNIYYRMCHNINITAKPKRASVLDFDPCSDYYTIAYLNNPQVQKALHANVTKIRYDWQPCSNLINNWQDSPSTIIPLLEEFMENGLRVWVYSGDTDGRVPVTSTKYSLKKMNLTVKTPYHPWYLHKEVGGYTEIYKEGLTFATVRGAGHEVPSFQPARALALIMHFLDGTPLPNKS